MNLISNFTSRHRLPILLAAVSILVFSTGCLSDPKNTTKDDHGDHDHGDHGHGDHDHGDHDHGDHGHGDHGHGDHGHGDHDHSEPGHGDHDHSESDHGNSESGHGPGEHTEGAHDKDYDGHHDESGDHVFESNLSTQQLLEHVQDSENFVLPEFTKKRK